MMQATIGPLKMRVDTERWPLAVPFRTAAHTMQAVDVMVVSIEKDNQVGRGEAAGVFYKGETVASMATQAESVRSEIESGITRAELQERLPVGGARNAIDCALWDLESRLTGVPAWRAAELQNPRPLLTTFTCGADEPRKMAAAARAYTNARAIKLKLTGEPSDPDRVKAVREAKPDVWLGIDGNQGLTQAGLERLLPVLVEMQVALIEQPFPAAQDAWLDGFGSPIPIAADESAQGAADLTRLVGRFGVVNIKLDKCGGMTEGLKMARSARALGLQTMVGNMLGTSLAMAPAFLVGQLCAVVDLDGPVLLKADRDNPVSYADGCITCLDALWGHS
jgi:L-alanine-DL-glutamate epimerase-like enolase superfamily enzyme